MNIYDKLRVLQTEIKVAKDQLNEFANFQYRTIDDIYAVLKPKLNELKLIIKYSDRLEEKSNTPFITSTLTLINEEKPDEREEFTNCIAIDLDRKKMSKEQMTGSTSTYAHKYLLASMLLLSDKNNADIDSEDNTKLRFKPSKPEVEMATSEQLEIIKAYAEKHGYDLSQFATAFKKDKLNQLTTLEAQTIINKMED